MVPVELMRKLVSGMRRTVPNPRRDRPTEMQMNLLDPYGGFQLDEPAGLEFAEQKPIEPDVRHTGAHPWK